MRLPGSIPALFLALGIFLLQVIPPRPGVDLEVRALSAVPDTSGTLLLSRREPLREGYPLFDPAALGLPREYQAILTGQLRVETPIGYFFWLRAPDRARLWIDGKPVAAAHAEPGFPSPGVIRLGRGQHALRIEYTRAATSSAPSTATAAGPPRVDLDWSMAWIKRRPLPPGSLFPPSTADWRLHARGPLWLLVIASALPLALRRFGLDARRRRRFYFRLAAVAVPILLCLGAAELILRLAGVRPRQYIPADVWLDYGESTPGKTVRYGGYVPYNIKEFENEITFNRAGWRDREYPQSKPEGAYRIVVLGDSYVEAKEVALDETFHKILERKLNAAPGLAGRRFEVLAVARGGWGTLAESRALLEHALGYHPDLVLLAFFAGNDVYENSPYLSNLISVWNREIYFERIVRAKLEFTQCFLLMENSFVNHFIVDRLLPLYAGRLDWFERELRLRRADLVSPAFQLYTRGTYPRGWDEAWRTTQETILKIRDTVEQNRLEFVLLSVYPDLMRGYDSDRLADRAGALDRARPARIMQEFYQKEKIEVLDLEPVFEAFMSRTGQPVTWRHDAHWNQTGHRLAADALYDSLLPRFK